MATNLQNQERLPENLKTKLALAVRSIQWSYAIFWSISERQPGVLKWGDGYYNGDIKTRKTIQSIELNEDELGLQRSEQLRELYKSLSIGEASPQARRPSAALSPEDLTDTEWYYLVCMSFVFDIGQGLPGTTLANGHPTWLCNAHSADSKVFSRSLLAKSASIQTVVCFPFMRGVVELGVTEQVLEDPSLIHHIKTSFLEIPYALAAKNSSARSDKELIRLWLKDYKEELPKCKVGSSYPVRAVPILKNGKNCHQESSFVSWKKAGLVLTHKLKSETQQKVLKKILLEVPRMHADGLLGSPEYNSNKVAVYDSEINCPLQSVRLIIYLYWTTQSNTFKSLKESNKIGNGKNSLTNKRKAPGIDEMEPDMNHNVSKDGPADNITVSMNKEDVLIEIKCIWREGILLEIMDVASHFHLDSHSVQSSTMDGILSLTIKSKHKGLNAVSTGTIKQALRRVAGKC
ncbi:TRANSCRIPTION FACTOR TT8 [Salix viminalis]|uniref:TRANSCRIPTION FACTOR TT8 n=1 Tax=Salix viminalis TaxID=40686 RepID=A0A9Q0TML8_SALVM|nr:TRANSCRIPTION FACTOR TT8 [Salix viminalis]